MTKTYLDYNSHIQYHSFAVFNPHNKPIEELPTIYGFNNGGSIGFMEAMAIAEDGTCLGSHLCSDECFMCGDLGIYAGLRKDRHEGSYQKHYPDGYKMDFVPCEEIEGHAALNKAFTLNKETMPLVDETQFAKVEIEMSTGGDQ